MISGVTIIAIFYSHEVINKGRKYRSEENHAGYIVYIEGYALKYYARDVSF